MTHQFTHTYIQKTRTVKTDIYRVSVRVGLPDIPLGVSPPPPPILPTEPWGHLLSLDSGFTYTSLLILCILFRSPGGIVISYRDTFNAVVTHRFSYNASSYQGQRC